MKTSRGFTIVELLIVVVVIAILAAITVVAYNGIQQRAENIKTVNSVVAYAKALNLYAINNSIYPNFPFPCLGKVSRCGNMTDNSGACNWAGQTSTEVAFESTLATVVDSLPAPSTQEMDCNGKIYSGAYYYSTSAGKVAGINYFLKGNVPCNSISGTSPGTRYQNSNTTMCGISLPSAL